MNQGDGCLECTALIAAASRNHTVCINRILDAPPPPDDTPPATRALRDINGVDASQKTPLIAAVAQQHLAAAKLLLERGADPNVHTHEHATALINAAIPCNEALMRVLLEHGANPDQNNRVGGTPLIVVAERGSPRCIRLLKEFNADMDKQNNVGGNPGLLAAIEGKYDCTYELLNCGASPDHQNLVGTSALMFALARDNPRSTAVLLAYHARRDLVPSNGVMPTRLAIGAKKWWGVRWTLAHSITGTHVAKH